jgi:ABC-type multidrug transport system fused ATPase/permease subunit
MTTGRRALYGLTNWALLAAGIANLAAGTWGAFSGSPAIAATSLTAGLVLLFAATIDRFESFKGLGIEAKTRQLDQKITQADEALNRLREMTELTGAALIDLNSKMGRWDSAPGPREFVALADRVQELMRSVGSNDEAVFAALKPWARTLCFDMARAQTRQLQQHVQRRLEELQRERQAIRQPMQPDDPQFARLTEQINSLQQFQESRLRKLHLLELADFPDKFMEAFDNVPQLEDSAIQPLRKEAARFAAGMLTLAKTRTLAERELWIETLIAAKKE